MDINMFRNINQ